MSTLLLCNENPFIVCILGALFCCVHSRLTRRCLIFESLWQEAIYLWRQCWSGANSIIQIKIIEMQIKQIQIIQIQIIQIQIIQIPIIQIQIIQIEIMRACGNVIYGGASSPVKFFHMIPCILHDTWKFSGGKDIVWHLGIHSITYISTRCYLGLRSEYVALKWMNHSLIIIRELTLSIFIALYFLILPFNKVIANDMIYRDHIFQYTPFSLGSVSNTLPAPLGVYLHSLLIWEWIRKYCPLNTTLRGNHWQCFSNDADRHNVDIFRQAKCQHIG